MSRKVGDLAIPSEHLPQAPIIAQVGPARTPVDGWDRSGWIIDAGRRNRVTEMFSIQATRQA
jgi:hypothetical protein